MVTNGGYPSDRNLYQAVKGLATGELVAKRSGTIIIMAECIDGIGHESFYKLVEGAREPDAVLNRIKDHPTADQWEAQILARILKQTEVIAVTKGVKDSQIEDMLMSPARNPEEALEQVVRKTGKAAEITVIPEGPFVIPYVPFQA
jgi:nickel-dependent lactate racemase